jgi:hypothetical protein
MDQRIIQRTFRLRDVEFGINADNGRVVTGHAAVFNSLSEELWPGVKEKIANGAFRDVLDNDVRLLFNHDPNHVLGRTKAGTLTLTEDAIGLKIRADLPDTTMARDLAVSMQRGDVDGMSFAFEVDPEDVRTVEKDGFQVDTILRVKRLYDVSVVTYPAYPAASAKIRAIEITSAPGGGTPKGGRGKAKDNSGTRNASAIASEIARLSLRVDV